MDSNSLKEGQALYDKSGRKVDEVESVAKRSIGRGVVINTRAGYKIGVDPDGTDQHGYTNVKPGTSDAKIKHRAMGGQSK